MFVWMKFELSAILSRRPGSGLLRNLYPAYGDWRYRL